MGAGFWGFKKFLGMFIYMLIYYISDMKNLNYRVLLRSEPEGGYTAVVPTLPGCITYGETIENAIKMAKEAIELYIESLKAHNEEIPTDDRTLEYNITITVEEVYA